MTPEQYVGRIAQLATAGLNREALDFAAQNEAAVEGDDEAGSRAVAIEPANDRCRAALEDAYNASLSAVPADSLDACDDAITVHRLIQVAAGDEQIAFHVVQRTVGNDEAKSPGIGDDFADDEVHAIRKSEPVAARLQSPTPQHRACVPLRRASLVSLQSLRAGPRFFARQV